jgi:hypothetical protein
VPLILTSKDFVTGLLYLTMGSVAIYFGVDYGMGVRGRMGPGYFPVAIGGCLIVIGVISVVRAVVATKEQISAVAIKPLLLITLSTVLFAYFLHRLGLVISLVLLLVLATLARENPRVSILGVVTAIGLIAFCAAVFVKGLGLPIPLIGYWLRAG